MKTRNYYLLRISYLLFVFGMFCFMPANATIIQLRLGPSSGQFSQVGQDLPNTVYPNNYADCAAIAWTNSGFQVIGRHYFQFDFSQLPAGARINSASLNLYGNTSPVLQYNSIIGGSNAAYLRRITQSWSSSTCCFNNQPSTTNINQVLLPSTSQSIQSCLQINVTNLVTDMAQANQYYGFAFMLQNESFYRCMNFSSGFCADTSKRPLLIIDYDVCNSFVLNDNAGFEDAVLANTSPSQNFIGSSDLVAFAQTIGTTQFVGRSLINFDFSVIPPGSTIQGAYLDLYSNTAPTYPATTLSGGNDCLLLPVSQVWNAQSVNFNNQPNVQFQNPVFLSAPISSGQNYLNLDMTQLFIDAYSNPGSILGFKLQLINEVGDKSLNLCSSNYPDSTKRPVFRVCWINATGIHETSLHPITVYPNPVSETLSITSIDQPYKVELFDLYGHLIFMDSHLRFSQSGNYLLNVQGLDNGAYILRVFCKAGVLSKKLEIIH